MSNIHFSHLFSSCRSSASITLSGNVKIINFFLCLKIICVKRKLSGDPCVKVLTLFKCSYSALRSFNYKDHKNISFTEHDEIDLSVSVGTDQRLNGYQYELQSASRLHNFEHQ